jgi:hypothetical protein
MLFRSQIQRVEEPYDAQREWGYDLLIQADKNGWPDWTDVCLPCLWIDRNDSVITWMGEAGRSFARQFADDIKASYMRDRFLQIMKTNQVLPILERTVAEIEVAIGDRPSMSENEYAAQDAHMFKECDSAIQAAVGPGHLIAAMFAQARESVHALFGR